MTLGIRIAAARRRLGKTQTWLGEQFGITDKAVSAWERNETIPEYEKIPKLRQILRVPYAWLMEGTGDPPPADDFTVRADDVASERYERDRTDAPHHRPQKTKIGRRR